MNVVRSQSPSKDHVKKLRAQHQERAKLAAASGKVPKTFVDDPAFLELVSKQSAPEIGSGMLVETKNDRAINDSG